MTLLGGYENDTHTVVRFSRLWNTCDQAGEDIVLSGDTVRLIWAYNPSDPSSEENKVTQLSYHGPSRRGVRSVYLKEKPQPNIPDTDLPYLKTWDLKARNTLLPNDDHTHYWCQIFKAPKTSYKHHMIGVKLMKITFNFKKLIFTFFSLSPLFNQDMRHTFIIWFYMSAIFLLMILLQTGLNNM